MTDHSFVTLSCPKCGGKRTVTPDTSMVVCEYCGSQYLVNADLRAAVLESQNACPTCHRNDRVEKVSSILHNQIHVIQGTTLQKQAVVTRKGKVHTQEVETPYNATQATALAQRLNQPPSQPHFPPEPTRPKPFTIDGYKASGRTKKIFGIVIAVLFILMGVCVAANPSSSSTTSATSSSTAQSSIGAILICPVTGLMIGALLWFVGNRQQHQVLIPEALERFQNESRARQDAYEQALEARNKQLAGYQKAVENWNNLYFCHRDDCIFVPGSGKSTSVSDLQRYLYSV